MQPRENDRGNGAVFPDLRPILNFTRRYFDLQVEGIERVPATGRMVIVANHGGWLAFDGVVVASLLYERFGADRVPIGFVEDILHQLPVLGEWARRLRTVGISEFHRWKELTQRFDVFGIFPEGTEGNCKPLSEAYRTQEFRRGFVRLALSIGAKVAPISIVGADETFPVLYKWRSARKLIGSIVPVPMCFVPIPVRWKVIFHEPLDFSVYDPDKVNDSIFCRKLAEEVRGIIQTRLDLEVKHRGAFPLAHRGARVADWFKRALEVPLGARPVPYSPEVAREPRPFGIDRLDSQLPEYPWGPLSVPSPRVPPADWMLNHLAAGMDRGGPFASGVNRL